ncbi:hypothetical protein HID58_086394 [Brassica napus]|uniref:Serine/threonine-protein kinase BSK n=1 Tax=Brassica napus TaxID=3708 RepID=A0ABQ7XSV3_BRANA|nr:hypothetical protein HID58_086394 [Brassica napus]
MKMIDTDRNHQQSSTTDPPSSLSSSPLLRDRGSIETHHRSSFLKKDDDSLSSRRLLDKEVRRLGLGYTSKRGHEMGNAATSMENSCLNRGPYCTSTATTKKIYAYIILFDEEGDPRLSTFGLMENSRDGKSYSTLHLSLYGQGEERIAIDGFISRQYENDDASKLVDLASKCLQSEAKDRPDTKFLLSAVAPLQN